jgi:hypothetical protein
MSGKLLDMKHKVGTRIAMPDTSLNKRDVSSMGLPTQGTTHPEGCSESKQYPSCPRKPRIVICRLRGYE